MPKKLKGDPLVSTGNVCYAEKMKDVFGSGNWGNLKFCRTILVTSGVSKKNTDEKTWLRKASAKNVKQGFYFWKKRGKRSAKYFEQLKL